MNLIEAQSKISRNPTHTTMYMGNICLLNPLHWQIIDNISVLLWTKAGGHMKGL